MKKIIKNVSCLAIIFTIIVAMTMPSMVNAVEPGEATLIDTLNINIVCPKVGEEVSLVENEYGFQEPDTYPVVSLESGTHCAVEYSAYITAYPSQTETGIADSFSGTFEQGEEYYVEVSLVAENGYGFASNDNMTVTVNGQTTNFEKGAYNGEGSQWYLVYAKVNAEDVEIPEENTVVVHTFFQGVGGSYTVQFEGNTNEGPYTGSGFFAVPYENEMTLTATPDEGYKFDGWYSTSEQEVDGKLQWVKGELLSSDLIYTFAPEGFPYIMPVFVEDEGEETEETEVNYTVKFETNGGSAVKNQTVKENGKAKEPKAPTKEDCEFDGWYKDKEFKEVFDFTKPITKNTTVYAKWSEAEEEENKEDDKVEYKILQGANAEVQEGKDLVVKADGDLDKLVELRVDNKALNKKQCSLESGSTIATLKAEFLDTLTDGLHKLSFIYTDGEISTNFRIAKADIEDSDVTEVEDETNVAGEETAQTEDEEEQEIKDDKKVETETKVEKETKNVEVEETKTYQYNPKTDDMGIGVWFSLIIVSICGIVGIKKISQDIKR